MVGEKPRGILNHKLAEKKFQLSLPAPSPDLQPFIEYYWIVSWDLRGQEPYLSENLPHPCIHLVFQKDYTRVYGVMRNRFGYLLEGQGHVFGIKFRAGGFYPFFGQPVARLAGKVFTLAEIFGADEPELEKAVLAANAEYEMVALVEAYLCRHQPVPDPNLNLISQIIECIQNDRQILKVEDLAERLGWSCRSLQRLFSQYVGVNPKWVIQRYRLLEAAEQLAADTDQEWVQLAQQLGYFDQAHFIKDFKILVGQTPTEYLRRLRQPI